MRQSKLFTKTKKEVPSDEISRNADLLIRGGFIHKEMAGVYSFLPLGLRVVNKISNIIRDEMDSIGGQEVKMTVLQDPEPWQKSGRWSDKVIDVWFKTSLKNGSELGLGNTHEEAVTRLLTEYISSYKDLPCSIYQIQVKLRNETRAKSGILRGREFLMKDMYSFSKDKNEHEIIFEKIKESYKNIFKKIGIGHLTYLTFASGGAFSKYSYEFQSISSVGEDTIYLDREKGIAINKEVLNDEVLSDLGITRENLIEEKGIEVGNIFTLGSRFSEPLNLNYTDEKGEKKPVFMGCYGMGPTRLMGTLVEIFSDDKGIIWPENVAPFQVHLLALGNSEAVFLEAEKVFEKLSSQLNATGDKKIEVLFDDRKNLSAGEKFSEADLLGIPNRVVISERSLKASTDFLGLELKKRNEEKGKIVSLQELIDILLGA
ncbi:MAG: aminoacyl--tRNA ligase-related protein [Patescibacteria group bacterium]